MVVGKVVPLAPLSIAVFNSALLPKTPAAQTIELQETFAWTLGRALML
jgi:hypothetical protein